MVGNALEVIEAIQCLHGQGLQALTQLTCDEGMQYTVSHIYKCGGAGVPPHVSSLLAY